MKLDPEIKKDVGFMAVGCGVCSVIVAAVFAVIGKFDMSVLIGTVVGYVLSFGNFVSMTYGVIKALETGDEDTAKLKMKSSYTVRTIIMLAVMGASIVLDFIHWVPVIVSVFYPRVIITARNVWRGITHKGGDETADVTASADSATPAPIEDDEEETDEFEKFVSGFSKGTKKLNSDGKNNSDKV